MRALTRCAGAVRPSLAQPVRTAGRSANAPSPSSVNAIRLIIQNAGYSQPPPLFVNSQPF